MMPYGGALDGAPKSFQMFGDPPLTWLDTGHLLFSRQVQYYKITDSPENVWSRH